MPRRRRRVCLITPPRCRGQSCKLFISASFWRRVSTVVRMLWGGESVSCYLPQPAMSFISLIPLLQHSYSLFFIPSSFFFYHAIFLSHTHLVFDSFLRSLSLSLGVFIWAPETWDTWESLTYLHWAEAEGAFWVRRVAQGITEWSVKSNKRGHFSQIKIFCCLCFPFFGGI